MAATQYQCGTVLRRGLVLEQGLLNGIDFLEVLDNDAPALLLARQTTLLLHLFHPGTLLGMQNFQINGGVRADSVAIVWAYAANAVPSSVATAAQAAYFAGLENAANIMVLRTNGSGDFSTYTLSVIGGVGQNAPPAGFDPRLSSVDFSFKVECPSDFDCAATSAPPQSSSVDLPIDYLAKDYPSFRQLMLDRMAITMPDWTERSPADIGVTLVETLAYAADRLSYFQDAVATEAYLGTARRRTSVRRHAVLLDYNMHDGCNARTWVFLEVDPVYGTVLVPEPVGSGQNGGGTLLFSQTNFLTGSVSVAQTQAILGSGNALIFETMQSLTARSANNEIKFYTWSDGACCLPAGSTAATLLDDPANPVVLSVGDVLLFEEVISPVTGSKEDADQSHRCVVRLTSVNAGIDPLHNIGILDITWASGDALPFSLCLSASIEAQGNALVDGLSVARGNMVLADHGWTIASEALSPSIVPSTGLYRPTLQQTEMTFCVAYEASQAMQQPAATQTMQDPRVALPAITLAGADSLWRPARTLLNALPFDRSFIVETEDDGSATLRFGDGQLGDLPESGLMATYRVGNGAAGNVGAESVTNIALKGFLRVRNPLPATGGLAPETLDQVRNYAPQAFRVQERAVTTADYATLAGAYPQVRKAQAVRRWTGSWYSMFVTVEREGSDVDADYEAGLAAYLDPFRLTGYDIEVEPPVFVPLDLAFTVCVADGYLRSNLETALYQAFSNKALGNGQTGFFHADNFTFGQPVYLSQIVSRAMMIPGVNWINTQDTGARQSRFQRWGSPANGEVEAGEITFARLEVAQLSNDPNAPEEGRIQFFMIGGL